MRGEFIMLLHEIFISFLSNISIYLFYAAIFGLGILLLKIKDVKAFISKKRLFHKVEKQKCTEPNADDLKIIFSLTPKEILLGEKIIHNNGKILKKISTIKDAPVRLAAEYNMDLSFAIDKKTGKPYKVIKFRDSNKIYYFLTNFNDLNHYLEMNDAAFQKYKKINNDNWLKICQ